MTTEGNHHHPSSPPSPSGSLSRLSALRTQRDYSPVAWSQYFDEAHDICPNSDKQDSFRVYLKNFHKPYAPDSRNGSGNEEITAEEMSNYSSKVPTLVTLHGGGYSALTWAQFTKHIVELCHCRIMTIDLRAHGDTKTSNDDQMDIETLVSDVIDVIHATHQLCGFLETPKLVIIGHSMGGAIAVKCSARCESLPSLAGFVIIDVVEGTAKDALPQMMSVIKTRPVRFPTLSNAIEWSVRSGMAKNSEAARVSMPGNLVNITTGWLAIHDIASIGQDKEPELAEPPNGGKNHDQIKRHKFHIGIDQLIGQSTPAALLPRLPLSNRVSQLKGCKSLPYLLPTTMDEPNSSCINEEDEDETKEGKAESSVGVICGDNDGYKKPPEIDATGYAWRTNLAKTQPHWNGWFDGLSSQLLEAPVQGKFLLLAGIDRLDKALTIGHMQGKFMMKVLPKCGHAVHEDVPEQVASAIGDYLIRNKFAAIV